MMRQTFQAVLLGVMIALSPVAVHADSAPFALEPGAAQRLGIGLGRIEAAGNPAPATRFAVATVLDSAPLLQLVDDKVAADAVASASHADAARVAALFANHQDVSQRAVEVARAQATADAARARTASSRFVVEWSPALAHPSRALIDGLVSGRMRLLRIEVLGDGVTLHPGQKLRLTRARGADVFIATVIGPASGPSAVANGPAWLAQSTAPMLHTLEPLTVAAPAPPNLHAAVLVPTAAVVMIDRQRWLFRVLADGRFARVALPTGATPVAGGFLVDAPAAKLVAGTRVVVRGAGALLSVESHANRAD